MPVQTVVSPLYNRYFPEEGYVEQMDWTNFKNEVEEFTAPLSARTIDFSLQDTTWVDTLKSIAQFAFTTGVVFYGVYHFGGSRVQNLPKLFFQALEKSNIQFFTGASALNFAAKCQNLTREVFTESVLQKGNLIAKAIFYTTTVRYILQRIVMIPLYPAQSRIVRFFSPIFTAEKLYFLRKKFAADCNRYGVIFRDVVLEKNGVRYSGTLIGHENSINNGNWALQATGNAEPIEHTMKEAYEIYHACGGYNVLMINGPAVAKNQGHAIPISMGDAQQVGIAFLETAIKAKNIVIAGRSLGGAAIGQAILQHDFKESVNYLAVSQMSFDKASNICGKTVGQISSRLEWIVEKLIQWVGCEMDSVAAAKKLQKLGITQVVIQASNRSIPEGELPNAEDFQTDGPIQAKASLGYALIEQGITDKKVFICLRNTDHMDNQAIRIARKEIEKLGVKPQ